MTEMPKRSAFTDRRRRIVDAAVGLFAQTPYAEVHMDAIAGCASVAKPTLYRYFPTKESLFIEALESALAELRREVQAARAEPISSEERLRRVITLMLDRVGRLAPAIRAVESRSSKVGEKSRLVLRHGFRDLRDEIGGLLAEGVEAGEFNAVDTEIAVLVVLGGIRMAAQARAGAALAGQGRDSQGRDSQGRDGESRDGGVMAQGLHSDPIEAVGHAVSNIFLRGLRVRDRTPARSSSPELAPPELAFGGVS